MLYFQNEGLIHPSTINLLGVNVKENDNAIGFFGTGLKYAIAITLRLGHSISIYRGMKEYKFSLRDENIRGKDFKIITMNEKDLGFTSELGKSWKPWMVLRELYCNAIDEPGASDGYVKSISDIPLHPNRTTVVVSGFDDVWLDNRSAIMNTSSYNYKDKFVERLNEKSPYIYYRGIRVARNADFSQSFYYSWNILRKISLTEDRTPLYGTIDMLGAVRESVLNSSDEDYIRELLTVSSNEYLESSVSYGNVSMEAIGTPFFRVLEKLIKDGREVNKSAKKCYENITGKSLYNKRDPSPMERKQIDRALASLKTCGYEIKYEISIADNLNQQKLGTVEDKTIILGSEAFRRGTKCVAGTIFEEYCHILYGFTDETYSFQNFLIDTLMSTIEQVNGEPM